MLNESLIPQSIKALESKLEDKIMMKLYHYAVENDKMSDQKFSCETMLVQSFSSAQCISTCVLFLTNSVKKF